MSAENLWGDLPVPELTKTPVAILKEQASVLTKMTKGVLVASVSSIPSGSANRFTYELKIRAPALNDYKVSVAVLSHRIEMYPLTVSSPLLGGGANCETEEAFVDRLGEIFKHPNVRKIVSSLLLQSNEVKPPEPATEQ